MAQNNSLQVKCSPLGDGLLIKLQGVINENLQLGKKDEGVIVFDLDEVPRITSFGVRSWINMLHSITKSEYFFVHCRPAIVSQFNMISNFGVRGKVATMYAPYRCPSCGKSDIEHLIDLRTQQKALTAGMVPAITCPLCKSLAEFDDLVEVYFEYARAQLPPSHPLLDLYLNRA